MLQEVIEGFLKKILLIFVFIGMWLVCGENLTDTVKREVKGHVGLFASTGARSHDMHTHQLAETLYNLGYKVTWIQLRVFDFNRTQPPKNANWGQIIHDHELNIPYISPTGVIVMSFGSITSGEHIPKKIIQTFMNVLGNLTQTVIWQFGSRLNTKGVSVPSNVYLYNWIPMQEILAGPEVRLMISHGGIRSITEAIHQGLPLLGIPIHAVQPHDLKRVVDRGAAEMIEVPELTEKTLKYKLQLILENYERYEKRAKHLSSLIRTYNKDLFESDATKFWLEWAVRHGRQLLKNRQFFSLIWPLKYCLDYRPFFTIHDSEFKEYTSRTEPPPNVILGVTNPFFTKTLQHWPHVIIRLGEISGSQNSSPVNSQKVKKGGDLRTLDNKAVYTQYKPFLAKDKSFLKRLAKGVESSRPSEVQSAILRRHFLEITQSFMIPLERYIASLMPLQRQISPFKTAPKARQFDFDEFLSTLDVSGPNLTSGVKGDWIGLYRRFVQTVNFEGWFHQRQKEVSHKLQLLHLEVLCGTDFSRASLEEMPEVELVDLVLKLRDKVEFVECNKDTIKRDLRKKLHQQVEAVLDVLNDDLKAVLLAPSSQQPLLVSESEIDQ